MNSPALTGYYRLRAAQQYFGQRPEQLDASQQQWLSRTVERQWQLESRILASREAQNLSIDPQEVESHIAELKQGYEHDNFEQGADFTADLTASGLTEPQWRDSIQRQLLVDKVMAAVAGSVPPIDDAEVSDWYENHPEQFIQLEQRHAFHLLITVNSDYAENRREIVIERLTQLQRQLEQKPQKLPQLFSELVQRHSECPTALSGGEIGWVPVGSLLPELDGVLFALAENQLSQPIETNMGFHLLLCRGIRPSQSLEYVAVAEQIREKLQRRQIELHQKQWLAKLSV